MYILCFELHIAINIIIRRSHYLPTANITTYITIVNKQKLIFVQFNEVIIKYNDDLIK